MSVVPDSSWWLARVIQVIISFEGEVVITGSKDEVVIIVSKC